MPILKILTLSQTAFVHLHIKNCIFQNEKEKEKERDIMK